MLNKIIKDTQVTSCSRNIVAKRKCMGASTAGWSGASGAVKAASQDWQRGGHCPLWARVQRPQSAERRALAGVD